MARIAKKASQDGTFTVYLETEATWHLQGARNKFIVYVKE